MTKGPRARWLMAVVAVMLGREGAAKRPAPCPKGKVRVAAKTALRRGPGLNFKVHAWLQRSGCRRAEEISMNREWVRLGGRPNGWIPVRRVRARDRRRVLGLKPAPPPAARPGGPAPVRLDGPRVLRARASATAEELRRLPAGAEVWVLASSPASPWWEVRDDAGREGWIRRDPEPAAAVDAAVPSDGAAGGAAGGAVDAPPVPAAETPAPARGWSLGLGIEGGLWSPGQRLDSDGVDRYRRYRLRAWAPGAALSAGARAGPSGLSFGLRYAFSLSPQIADGGGDSIGGRFHDARAQVGWGFTAGSVRWGPELGYVFRWTDLDPALPGAELGQFVSTRLHGGSLGLSAELALHPRWMLRARAAGGLGRTQDGLPFDLGTPGLTRHAAVDLGVRGRVNADLFFLLGYRLLHTRTAFEGPAGLDPTINEAALVEWSHAWTVGLGLALPALGR